MEPNIWGPPAWLFLHSITFNFPHNPTANDRQNYNNFFYSLQKVIPCPKCRRHYSENLKKIPIRLQSRDDLIRWLIDIHNAVNKSTNKPTMSYEDVYEKYDKLYNKKEDLINDNKIKICIAIIILFIFGYYIYKNESRKII